MALFQQVGDGRARGRTDAAGGAGDENSFLGHGLPDNIEYVGKYIVTRRFDYVKKNIVIPCAR
jgi:hypothetical protein